jgi:multidrug resistance efflux pump
LAGRPTTLFPPEPWAAVPISLDEFETFIVDGLYQEKMMEQACSEAQVAQYFKLDSPRFDSVEVSHSVLDSEGKAREMMSVLQDEPESSQARSELETSGQQLSTLRLQYEAATREATNVEDKLKLQVQTARLVADAAARIQFENIDKDNFLRIVAPVDGVITDVTSTQPGDKFQANTPLGGIAPKNTRPLLKIEIAEQDRGFVREGLPVQLKFNAFPSSATGRSAARCNTFRRPPSLRRRASYRCTKGAWRSSATATRLAIPLIRCATA